MERGYNMNSFVNYFLIFLTFLPLAGFSQTTSETLVVKPHMQEFFNLTSKIQPYLLNKSEYLDVKNEKILAELLTDYKDKTILLKKEKFAQTVDMKFRAQQLAEGLEEAAQTYKDGFRDYSYWVFKSTLNQCFTCHTQKSLEKTQLKFDVNNNAMKVSNFAKAEFLFLVRNYDEAIPLFEKIVSEYPKNGESVENTETSLYKLLFYSVRVLNDDSKSEQLFERLLKNKELPEYIHHSLVAWKNYLKIKKYRVLEDIKILDLKSLKSFINERESIAGHYTFSRQRYIVDLETSQVLFKLLEKDQNKKMKPWYLFYLAQTEMNYRTTMFDSTSELYLKECIEVYSKSSAAPKCLDAYAQMKKEAYTGSCGLQMPKSISDQIKKYEKLIQNK